MGTVTSIGEMPADVQREAGLPATIAGHDATVLVLAVAAALSGFLVGCLLMGVLWLVL